MNETTHGNPPPPRRRVTATTVIAGLLALVALGVVGVAVSEYRSVQENLAHNRDQLTRTEAELARVKYDEQGNVVDEDRERYEEAMMMIQLHTSALQTYRAREPLSYPYIGGGVLAFLVFTFLAVRSTRRA